MKTDITTFYPVIIEQTINTLIMVAITLIFATLIGLPIGILLYATAKGNILENKVVNSILNAIINTIRPIPFIIFLVALIPITRILVGTSIGIWAAIFPMTLAASLSIARIVENNIVSVDRGVIEAAEAMGSSKFDILFKVLIPEAAGALILGLTFTTVSLIEFSAVAGLVGAGGIGYLAFTYGYQRFDVLIMFITVVILIILVQITQFIGNKVASIYTSRL
ncbi:MULTISPECIES: methionine ABC transporter permease [Macrococcus]|uniref:Methionine ABC transporter permease n=1 Tax=Macrococcus psychrotolerans TaxID=3039389 RepID=A0AAT9P8A0_9STAP|nr:MULTISPECIES: methionine ABC transporter permease [Macrococcus]MDJ1111205.1 methionine ABC transporter permease [Macrococcus sp. S115]QYA33277.1 ABC transporter permease [Macrococcus sp. 19Msa1099]QYA38091.1 ABC transporter permease [Macrococcus caseolyticus]QYA76798.1 ABC transporter permease [Macrococcus caseolyticus]